MATIREVLYQYSKGNSQRLISRSLDISRDTVRKYITLANQENFSTLVSDDTLNKIAIRVEEILYQNEQKPKSTHDIYAIRIQRRNQRLAQSEQYNPYSNSTTTIERRCKCKSP